jgi:hypothetical protein
MTEDEMVKNLPPISDQLRAAIDRETQEAYSKGASAVWRSLGCPTAITGDPGNEAMPNEAVHDEATGFYVVRPRAK